MTRRWLTLLGALFVFAFQLPAMADADRPRVRMQTTMGQIVLELDRSKAPKTVDNFVQYVNAGFYDDTIFHRVIDGFMIQGGGYTADYRKKPTRAPVMNEADKGLKNKRGTIAMARTSDPHSATAQFFINVADNHRLDHRSPARGNWGYAVFGHVVEGMDVVDKIRKVRTGPGGPLRQDVPQTPVIIEKITIITESAT